MESLLNGRVRLACGDNLEALPLLTENSIESCVTDPPYGLNFMGAHWDRGVPGVAFWREVYRVLKPGAHMVAFGAARCYHRMACAIEDAGFEIRDSLMWIYGTGFPKSYDVSKGIDKLDAVVARRDRALQFTAWLRSTGLTARRVDALTGTCMGTHYTTEKAQPCIPPRAIFELLRPHFRGGVPEWIEQLVDERLVQSENFKRREVIGMKEMRDTSKIRAAIPASALGRDTTARRVVAITAPVTPEAIEWEGWGTALKPAFEPIVLARKPLSEATVAENVLRWRTGALNIDGSRTAPDQDMTKNGRWPANVFTDGSADVVAMFPGNAARIFYSAKADKADRAGSKHPTVKPVSLMQWLTRLITPPGGTVLDPFAGSGTTGEAAYREGLDVVLMEREAEYQQDIRDRMKRLAIEPHHPAQRKTTPRAKPKAEELLEGPLFAVA
jgi:site-specific DNA-methyltransferase (adenine-specific)